ncbi:hypothetical protein WH47_08904 [Habropoda laboriosa]|uniref:Uncharacterized protein n=1 Tax=Habropoda laboriosa TaxID=597456 RepID=A0A0L7R6X7_9HYME|nr:hypothetical protein WH47_08904 [Habropoda laboriosa]
MKSLSNSDSEDWSTKSSSRNADCIDKWSLEPNSEHSNSYVNNLKGSYPVSEDDSCEASARRNLERVCKCGKKGGESTGRYSMRCNCKKRSSKTVEQENLMQPWLICNCIREEEEEDCVDDKASKKFAEEKEEMTVCRGALENLEEPKLVPCADYSGESRKSREKLKEALEKDEKREVKDTEEGGVEEVPAKVEESEEKSTKSVRRTSMPFASRKLIRPEVMVLRNILKHEVKQPAQTVDQKSVAPVKKADSLEQPVKNGGKTTQDILKRFNIPEEYKFLKKPAAEEEQTGEKNEKVEEKKVEVKGNKEDKDTKNLQGKLKNTFAFKRLKKILGKTEFPEKRDEGSIGKDKINESTSNVGDVKNVENPKTNVDGDQLPVKDNEIKGRHKEKERFNFSKLNLYRTMKNKKDKPEQNTTTNSPTIKEHKNSDKSDNVIDASVKKEDTQETTSEIDKETKNKSKQTPVVANENSPALPTQDDTQLTKRGNSENSQKLSEPKRIIKNPKVDEPAKRTQFEKKLNIQEEKKADPEEPTIQDERKPTRKLSFNEMKESSPSQHPQHHKIDPRTICTNSKYPKSSTMNESFTSICNCCCSSISEYTNEPINYPKSCLKKDRTLYQHVDSQRSNFSLPYRDKRSWEDCGCRRIIPCNVCCRPRNDASCRLATSCCTDCYKPKNKCNCKVVYDTKKNTCECMKWMFCLYCDNPRDKCTCRAPLAKCSYCELSTDLCTCKDQKTIRDGRPVLAEPDNDRTMYVTAWKPREEVRRYFSRNLADLRVDSIKEHCYCEKLKPHNSDDLPYQRLSIFSDVMDELQQKMSESTCCTRCRKIPCCCNIKADRDEVREERKIKYRISCVTARERGKPRPCRCADSPCRTIEKESAAPCGKISTKPKNNDEKAICIR